MQQRRLRPGDVLDDYCPRERRITDHAIVAMIDDHIKQTRCVVCDAEHEYKEAKVPAQRRKKAGGGLFGQVLDGLQPARLTAHAESPDLTPMDAEALESPDDLDEIGADPVLLADGPGESDDVDAPPLAEMSEDTNGDEPPHRDEGPVRRPLIRATLPRAEGQAPPARVLPEFTIRQPNNGRNRPGGRRRRGHQGHGGGGGQGFTRFGHGGQGGQRQPGGGSRNHGPNGGRPRRGGKKR